MMKLKPGVKIHQQEKMGDGRRHSVDIPLSKTLMTLKRVRSLRDPSTISMNKFMTTYDNIKLEIDELALEGNDVGGNIDQQQKSRFCTSDPRNECCHDSNLDSGNESKMDDPQFTPNNNKPSRLQNGNGWQNLLEEDGDSYSEPGVGHTKRHNGRVQMKKAGHHHGIKNLATAVEDVSISRIGSPCLSLSETQTNRSRNSLLAFTNDDNNAMDSNYSGCGLSSCWSRTPKFRDPDSYFEMDDQEHPLLSVKRKDETYREVNLCLDSPRSLSQKYRPKTFDELVGQHVIAQSLMNATAKTKISPMYLFHGPRGTGKTSMARVFAAALNCLSLEAYRPCGFCRECVFIFSGRSRDVKELDGSKINRKDRIKALLKSASLSPYSASFKVYIVDECQCLLGETWPAISNSIEASRRTIFIMITSEPEKLPSNTISRCQRYHFPKIKDTDVASRLQRICIEEALEFDKDALDFIASKSNGSLRDAEVMLDQLSLLGKNITIPLVQELVGVISDDELLELLDLALSSDASNTVRRARELMNSKVDPMQLTSQLANLIMDILAGKLQSECSDAVRSFLGRHSLAEAGLQKLRHALKILSETEKQLRASKNQATWLTVALLQFSSDDSSSLTEGDDPKAILKTMCLRGSPRESQNGSCDHKNSNCSEKHCDTYKKLNFIWRKAAEKCQTDSFRKFLLKEGKLSSIRVSQGLAIAEIQFSRSDGLSRAEKSWKQIAAPLRLVLGCNVEMRISLAPSTSKQTFRMKKPSFGFLSCGQRQDKCDSIATEDNDMETCTSKEGFFQVYTDDYGQNLSPMIDLTNGAIQIQEKEPPCTRINNKGNTPSVDGVSSNGTMQPSALRGCHDAVSDVSKDNGEDSRYFCMQEEPEQHHRSCCFPKVLRPRRKYLSADVDSTICSNMPPHNKLEMTSPSLASSDLHYCSSNSYVFCAKSDELTTYNTKEGALLKKHGKDDTNFHCWDAAKSSIIKGCDYRQKAQSTRWVFPCFQGKPPRPTPVIAAGTEVRS